MDIDGAPLCRVCRSDDSTLGPLFHPCRCTGSIAHVHQDCLSTWLTHSKKSTCELCGHLFSFEKVYKPGSPDRPPFTTITYQALKELIYFFLLFSRAILVGICWLGIVPWTVVWVSTAYWKAADWFAFGLTSNIDQLSRSSSNSSTSNAPPSTSTSTSTTNSSTHSPWINNLIPSLHLDPNSIALDIFQGQLITCAIILSFVVIFLLREWILQNTPPPDLIRLAEDEEIPQRPLQPPPAPEQLRPPPLPEPVEQVLETQYQTTDRDDLSQDHNAHQANTTVHSPEYNDSINLTPLPPSQNALEEEDSHSQLFAFTSNSPMTPSIFSNSETAWIEVDQKSSLISSSFSFPDHLVPTPGLLELADPGLGMPFYKPHDPIDSEIFSHRILVTSTYLLFVAQVSDTPLLAVPSKSPHFGDPDDSQKRLMEAWSNLAELTILHPSNDIQDPILQLRTYVSRSFPDDDPTADTIKYQQIEFNWTRALLSDPKISKHIQYLFNTRCYSTATVQTQDQFRINGLVYSLLSIYNSVESQSTLLEASSEEVESVSSNTFEGYQRIYDLMRLFVLPLLDVPNRESCSQRLIQLETDINELIRKYDPVNLPDASFDDPSSLSSFMSLKDRLVEILVKQRILSTLINSTTFVRYSRGMASDDNLFTNWRLKSTRPFSQSFLSPQRVNNPENDLSEITIQLINFKATIEPRSKSSQPDEISVGWIDHATFDHKLLVTSSYLLLSDEAIETSFPVLQTPTLIDLLENSTDQEQSNEVFSLKAWYKLAKSCCTANQSELLPRFKNFTLHISNVSVEDRNHSFQRLESEWLSKLLSDSSIAQFLVLILTDQNEDEPSMINLGYHTPNFFLLKLVYVYTVLETLIPRSENQQSSMIYENASKILLEHLSRLQSETPDLIHPVLEMIRETKFLLDSCQPAKPNSASSNHNSDVDLRSELLITRMKRGIIGILARQKVLGMIVTDGRFAKYARAMLSEPDLFARISSLPILEQLEEEDQNILDYERIDKGKHKAPDDSAVLNDEEAAEVNSEEDRPLHAQINEEESINKSENLAESSILDQSFDPSSHIDTFDWSEDAGKSSSQASSTHPDGIDILSSDTKPIDSCLGNSTNLPPTESTSLEEDIFSAEKALPTNLPPIGTPAPGRRPMIRRPPVPAPLEPQAENVDRMPNPDIINRGRLQAAERAVAGRLPGFGPQRLQREVGIGAGLVDGFVFDDPGLNPGEDELMAEDIDGILELIGMKGSLLMLAQNVGLMTMLLSLSLLAFVHLPHMIGKIAVLSKAHRLLAPPFKGLLILQGYVHRMLDYLSDYVKLRLLKNYQPPEKLQQLWSLAGSTGGSFSGLSQLLNRWPITELVRLPKELMDRGRPVLSKIISWNKVWQKIVDRVGDRLNGIAYGSKPTDRALAVLLGYSELALMSLFYLSSGLDQQRARFVSETIVHGIQQQFLIAKVGIFIFIELVIFPFLCGLLLNFTTIPIFVNASLSNRLELYSSAPYSASLITWLVGTCFMFSFAILVSTCRESLRAGVCWWIRDPSDDRFNPIREILERSAWSQVKKISASAIMYGAVVIFGLGSIVFNLIFFTGTLPLRIHADRPISSSALDLVIYQTFLPFFLECFQPRTKLKESLQSISRYMARQLRLTCYLYGERRIAEETTLEWVVLGSDGQFRPLEKKVRFSPMNFFKSYQCPTPSSSSSGKKRNSDTGHIPRVPKGAPSRTRKWAGGSFARVPASDAVKVVPGRKMHIPVHVDGTPIDQADMEIIEQQQAEAREEGGGAGGDQYTIVYLPPQFQSRMLLYVISMWTAAVVLGWQSIGIPLLVGRILLDRFILSEHEEPHDVYAYALGVLTCALLLTLGSKAWNVYSRLCPPPTHRDTGWGAEKEDWLVSEEDSEEEEDSDEEDHDDDEGSEEGSVLEVQNIERDARPTRAERTAIWKQIGMKLKTFIHLVMLITVGGIMLPILTSVLVELYLLGLVKSKQTGSLPSIFLLEAWTYGCIYLSIGARTLKLLIPGHTISIALDQIVGHWRAGDMDKVVEDINLKLVVPIGYRIALLVLVPFILVQPIVLLLTRDRGTPTPNPSTNIIDGWRSIFGIQQIRNLWNHIIKLIHPNFSSSNNDNDNNSGSNESEIIANSELSYKILRLVYPIILSWISQFIIVKIFFHFFSNWIEKVRDDRFLEKRRLK
ncbi:hypothetical protein H4Q26_012427, partial [Puccinia striiformis f. sp. tritici PST-130]